MVNWIIFTLSYLASIIGLEVPLDLLGLTIRIKVSVGAQATLRAVLPAHLPLALLWIPCFGLLPQTALNLSCNVHLETHP